MPGSVAGLTLLVRLHFDQYVSRIEHLLRNHALAAANFDDLLGRYQNAVDFRI